MTIWREVRDGYPPARELADRHYSRKSRGSHLFVGPGERLILLTPDSDALFVWRRAVYRLDGQTGVECTLFRNEGLQLSSDLIREACRWAWQRWPGQRLFTYVDPGKVVSANPGYCFMRAGWRRCGRNKSGALPILEAAQTDAKPPTGYAVQGTMFEQCQGGS